MKVLKLYVGLILATFFLAGCATVVTQSNEQVSSGPAPKFQECLDMPDDSRAQIREQLACMDASRKYWSNVPSDWQPIEPGSSVMVDVATEYYPRIMTLQGKGRLAGEVFDNLKVVMPSDQGRRDAVIRAMSRYHVEYDQFDKAFRVTPSRLMSGPYSKSSYVSFQGLLSEGRQSVLLKFQYYGSNWLFLRDASVLADGVKYDVSFDDVRRDNSGGSVWEYAFLPLTDQNREMARAIASGNDVQIRFRGRDYYRDVTVKDKVKEDIGLMLDALDALGGS